MDSEGRELRMRQRDFPEWARRVKEQYQGTQLRRVGNNIYLYAVTSRRIPGKKYPVLFQSYMGIVTQAGLVEPQSFQFRPMETEVCLLENLPGVSGVVFTADEWKTVRHICLVRNGDNWFYPGLSSSEEQILQEKQLISPVGAYNR